MEQEHSNEIAVRAGTEVQTIAYPEEAPDTAVSAKKDAEYSA